MMPPRDEVLARIAKLEIEIALLDSKLETAIAYLRKGPDAITIGNTLSTLGKAIAELQALAKENPHAR